VIIQAQQFITGSGFRLSLVDPNGRRLFDQRECYPPASVTDAEYGFLLRSVGACNAERSFEVLV